MWSARERNLQQATDELVTVHPQGTEPRHEVAISALGRRSARSDLLEHRNEATAAEVVTIITTQLRNVVFYIITVPRRDMLTIERVAIFCLSCSARLRNDISQERPRLLRALLLEFSRMVVS